MLTLRSATPDDSDLLFAWRNDPEVIRMSLSGKPVTRAEHDRWFPRVLADHGCRLYVAEADQKPIGTARIDSLAVGLVVSVTLAAEYRERGYALDLLWAVIVKARAWEPRTRLVAYVRQDNVRSLRAFLRAGFRPEPRVLTLEFP